MSLLDAITFGYMAIAIIQARNSQESSGIVAGTTLMGMLGAICGGILATLVFGVQAPFTPTHLFFAVGGLFLLLFLGRIVGHESLRPRPPAQRTLSSEKGPQAGREVK